MWYTIITVATSEKHIAVIAENNKIQHSDLELTKEIHDYFIGKIAKATGIYESYENQPEKYVQDVYKRQGNSNHG